ncbi:MAG: tRNA pseudouridine(38-40) synthase TruA [Deltaproteobacteria bacterium]|nr:tRNA pseudouridine(38-40) synthase TruA [Deltaproteobacteria bacterium]MDL1961588.1 tRNA pseudouridine(38-40) synthase TruA [Deltaproteobacteria bacterium]
MDSSDQSCPPFRNIKLTIQYNGTKYHGWQRQISQISIQGVIEAALEKMTGEQVCLIGSGRTDTGVHALAQVANFHTDSKIPLEGFLKGLNSLLPEDIAILATSEASPGFHSTRDSICKIYCYHILVSDTKIPFWNERAWLLNRSLDIHSMEKALSPLIGTHDFSAFKASGSNAKTVIRTIYSCEIKAITGEIFPPSGGLHYMFTIAANGFLRYMVRNIVGLLVQIGLGTRSHEDMVNVLASKDRSLAGPTAPPQGLYLKQVFYDESEIPFIMDFMRKE